ncbi:MAG: hypothetical protein QOJ65_1130 [Fimbriimonadaceae bacterium]|nr:hypothetical protein [Fimbriimonadaceae bacterium]
MAEVADRNVTQSRRDAQRGKTLDYTLYIGVWVGVSAARRSQGCRFAPTLG